MRFDRRERLAVLPLQDPEAPKLLAAIPEDERLTSWRLARRDGTFASHLGVRGRVPDAIYRALAGRRNTLGRLVPDGPAPRRFP
ncbi:MAG TPA: hypothetical protein VFU84_11810 [Gaiellaceae bacterium]|nr:hypothetical protein [Gaiellaceae bacterium]